MTSAENSISEPPNLKIVGGEDTPHPPPPHPYNARTLAIAIICPPPPAQLAVTKNLATALQCIQNVNGMIVQESVKSSLPSRVKTAIVFT